MTALEYRRIREMIEGTFRLDMAALERVWFRVNGCNPPESPVAFAGREEQDSDEAKGSQPTGGGLRSAVDMGIMPAGRMDAAHQGPRKKKSSGRALGWAKFRAKKAGKDPETMTEAELQEFVK